MPALSLVPATQDAWSALLERPDVALDGGMLHLVHDTIAPAEARVADLLFVADVLEGAGIGVTLIRHDRTVPALVVDVDHRADALAALAAAP